MITKKINGKTIKFYQDVTKEKLAPEFYNSGVIAEIYNDGNEDEILATVTAYVPEYFMERKINEEDYEETTVTSTIDTSMVNFVNENKLGEIKTLDDLNKFITNNLQTDELSQFFIDIDGYDEILESYDVSLSGLTIDKALEKLPYIL